MRASNSLFFLALALIFISISARLAAQESPRVMALQSKGQALLRQGHAAEGIKAFEDAVEMAIREYGPDDEQTLLVKGSLAGALQAVGRFDDAVTIYEKVTAAIEAKYGPDHQQTYVLVCGLGKFYNTASRYDDALKCFHRSLKGLEKTLEPGHVAILEALEGLINTYINAGRAPEAEPYLRRKIQILEGKNGPEHPDTVSAQQVLMGVLLKAGRLDEAEASIVRALDALKARVGDDHVQTARLRGELARIKTIRGHHAEARPLIINALAVLEKQLGHDHLDTCKAMGILGELYRTTAEFDKAEPVLRDRLATTQKSFGLVHAETLEAFIDLSNLLVTMGRREEAEALLQAALKAIEQGMGPNHQAAVALRNGLAILGRPTSGTRGAGGAKEIERAYGKGSLEASLTDSAIELKRVNELVRTGRAVEAEAILRRNLTMVQEKFGADHPLVGSVTAALGMVYLATGRLKDSEEHARRALTLLELKFGPDHPHTASDREVLAAAVMKQGRVPEALDLFDVARRSRRRLLEQTLPALSEDDQLEFLQTTFAGSFTMAMGAAWSAKNHPGVPEKSASWVLNHKAVALSALAQRAVLARDAADPRVAPIVRDLTEARRHLAALALTTALRSDDSVGPKQKFDELVARERELSRQLGQALNRPHRPDPWVGLDDTFAALPPDTVLIEFARVNFGVATDSSAKPIGPVRGRYVAWAIPPQSRGSVTLVDLGESEPIDAAIAAVRQGMRLDRTPGGREGVALTETEDRSGLTRPGGTPSRRETESDAVKRLAPALETLARLVLGPLRSQIESFPRWLLCPDSALWLVPWQALPQDDGRYAIEQHLIHLVVSGRDLVSPVGKTSMAPPVHFADPDFDLAEPGRGEISSPTRALAGLTAAELATVNRALPAGFRAARLEGTGKEAEGVRPLLARFTDSKPELYLQAKATEARFRELHRPRVLILSTHGFFLDQSEASAAGRLPANPLLRCGLLLAGANHRVEAGGAGGDNQGLDGVLTGLEIVGSDLQGTSLVVLSACETGLGEVQSGEGVAGLRQAFQLAGAQAVVATLWQIPDLESSRLMIGFFGHLCSGLDPASALRRAQLDEIDLRRRTNGAAHPYYWAAFTLTGVPGATWREESLAKAGPADLPPSSPLPPQDPSERAVVADGPVADRVISPVTGRPDANRPLSDLSLAVILLSSGLYAARKWWLLGQ
jgi:CHAT domain-containing protein/tetratricopeptide (TPR) repeat protein